MQESVTQSTRPAAASSASGGAWRQDNDPLTQGRGWSATLRIWVERSRQRRALAERANCNDHLLKDLGLSQEQARREAAKPFWRR